MPWCAVSKDNPPDRRSPTGPTPAKQARLTRANGPLTALVVGVSSYPDGSGFGKLPAAENDATRIAKALDEVSALDCESVTCLTESSDEKPTRGNILGGVNDLANRSQTQDRILFYISGHGIVIGGDFYLVPNDAHESNDPDILVHFKNRVLRPLESCAARQKIIVLDTCFSGAGYKSSQLWDYSPDYLEQHVAATQGVAVLGSSSATEPSIASSPGKDDLSLFTFVLLRALRGAPAALNDGLLSLASLQSYLDDQVPRFARQLGHLQHPTLGKSGHGDFVFGYFDHETDPRPPDDPGALAATVERYLRPIRDAAIHGASIPRAEAQVAIRKLEAGERQGVLIVGEAGVGKSGVIAQVTTHLAEAGWPVVALRLDRLEPTPTARGLGAALDLSDSPTASLLRVAAGQPCLVVVDQLDAVSKTSGRHPKFFERVGDLLADVRAHANLRVLMGCRAFDLREDHRIRLLVHPKRGIAAKVEVRKLGPDVVRGVVERAGRDARRLTEKQLELLSLPFHLWLWTVVVDEQDLDEQTGTLDTARELLDLYWQQQSNRLDQNHPRAEGRWLPLLDAVLDYMGEKQVPSAPSRVFQDEHRVALDAMLSERVLVRDAATARLAFPHEAIFDYLFARRFIARGRTLMGLLRGREQSLFLRTTVRQVLQHMRSGDSEDAAYAQELKSLLLAEDVRFHIKQVVLAWLGARDDPRPAEWAIVKAGIARVDGQERWQWDRRTRSEAWFDLLWREGFIQAELASGDDERIAQALGRLASVATTRAELVCNVAESWLGRPAPWPARIATVMGAAHAHDTNRWVELFFSLAAQHPELAKQHLGGRDSRFFEDLPEKEPASALRIATSALFSGLRDWWSNVERSSARGVRPQPPLSLDFFGDSWSWRALAEHDPAGFTKSVLPMVLETARMATPRVFVHPRRPMPEQWWWGQEINREPPLNDWIWFYITHGLDGGHGWGIVSASLEALRLLAASDPGAFYQALDSLIEYRHFLTGGLLLLRALHWVEADRADWVIELLLANSFLLKVGYSDASFWFGRELIERWAPSCSDAPYQRLEALLLNHTTDYERRRWRADRPVFRGRDRRLRWMPYMLAHGTSQFTLLGALPETRRGPAVRRRLGELRRRFDRDDERGPLGIRGGTIGPPFNARWERMSDVQWLRAMATHHAEDRRGWGDDMLKGGASQLGSQLEARATAEPTRYAELFLRIPPDANPTYRDAILRGVTQAAKDGRETPPAAVWSTIRSAYDLPGRPCGRWSGALVEAYAKHAVPDDIIDIVGWYATEDPSPAPDERGFIWNPGTENSYYDADNHGLNTVRGGMCSAIRALLFASEHHITRLRPAIARLVHDPTIAVRTQVPYTLLPMLNFEANTAVEHFVTLCEFDDERVTVSRAALRFLKYACQTHLDRLESLMSRMLASPHDGIRQEAARQLSLAVYRGQRDATLLDRLWATDDASVRAALVLLASEVATYPDHARHRVALTFVERGFASAEKPVQEAAVELFRFIDQALEKRPLPTELLEPIFRCFIKGPAFEGHRSRFFRMLKRTKLQLPDITIEAFQRALTMESSARLFEASLIYRLYEDTKDAAIRQQCLDLIDGLLRRGEYDLQRTLDALDTTIA